MDEEDPAKPEEDNMTEMLYIINPTDMVVYKTNLKNFQVHALKNFY